MHLSILAILLLASFVVAVVLLNIVKSIFPLEGKWWGHLPAMWVFSLVVVVSVVLWVMGSPFPAFYIDSVNQRPTRAEFLTYFVPLGIIFMGISMVIDELWARQEIRKSFNWFALLDEAVVAGMLFPVLGRGFERRVTPEFHYFVKTVNSEFFWFVLGVIALAAILEIARRPIPREAFVPQGDAGELEAQVRRRIEAKEQVAYFERQNPAYVTILVAVTVLAMLVGAILTFREAPWVALLLLISIAGFGVIYGGLRVSVTGTLVEVRLGRLGIHLLSLPTAEIAEVTIHEFQPLKDFGGYGIRRNREMKAYFMRGNVGVKIKTTEGKQYLIGSDTPERLAAVLRGVSGKG